MHMDRRMHACEAFSGLMRNYLEYLEWSLERVWIGLEVVLGRYQGNQRIHTMVKDVFQEYQETCRWVCIWQVSLPHWFDLFFSFFKFRMATFRISDSCLLEWDVHIMIVEKVSSLTREV